MLDNLRVYTGIMLSFAPTALKRLPLLAALAIALSAGLVNGAPASNRQAEALTIGGYVHAQWQHSLSGQDWPAYGFELRRVRVKLEYEPSPVEVNVELGMDELRPSIKDAFVRYRVWSCLRFTAGLAKMPFSREELTPASRLTMVERGITSDRFTDLGYLGRDIGLAFDGEWQLARRTFGYALGVFNGNGTRLAVDDNNAKQFAERVTFRPVRGLDLGLNATQRNDSATGKPVMAGGADFLFRLYETTVEGEVLTGESESGSRMAGAALTAAYRLGVFEPGLRLERLIPDFANRRNGETEVTLGCNWQLHRQVRLQANLVTDLASGQEAKHGLLVQVQGSY